MRDRNVFVPIFLLAIVFAIWMLVSSRAVGKRSSVVGGGFARAHTTPAWADNHAHAWAIVSRPGCPGWCVWLSDPDALRDSAGNWWPASSIKLWAAIGAYKTLYSVGLDGDSPLILKNRYGRVLQRTTANSIVRATIRVSSNKGYDTLARIARLDLINHYALLHKMDSTYLGQAYASGSLDDSPALWSGSKLYLPAFHSRHPARRCKERSNCTSLLDLQKILYGAVHNHFRLKPKDWRVLVDSLAMVRTTAVRTVRRWCKVKPLSTWSKGGFVRGYDKIEVVYWRCGSDSWLLSISVPARQYKRRLEKLLRTIHAHLP